jgi:hypothetical protein
MNKVNQHTVAAKLDGVVLGYYELADKLQLASIAIESGIIRRCEIRDFWNLHEMLGYLIEQPQPLGIGIPAVLALSTGRQGWRAADYWLDEAPFQTKSKYDEFPFYWGPYQMTDHRSLSSIAMLCALRRRWPDLFATETNVPLCYLHAAKSIAVEPLIKLVAILSNWMGITLPTTMTTSQWEAVMAGYAMWMGLSGRWPIDLHKLTKPAGTWWIGENNNGISTEAEFVQPALSFESLIFPAGPVSFFWPPDDRAGADNLHGD